MEQEIISQLQETQIDINNVNFREYYDEDVEEDVVQVYFRENVGDPENQASRKFGFEVFQSSPNSLVTEAVEELVDCYESGEGDLLLAEGELFPIFT